MVGSKQGLTSTDMLDVVLIVKWMFGVCMESCISMLVSFYCGITDLQGSYYALVHRAVFKCQFPVPLHSVRVDPEMQG